MAEIRRALNSLQTSGPVGQASIIERTGVYKHQNLPLPPIPIKVIYEMVLTTKPLEDREFQFGYITYVFSNTLFIKDKSNLEKKIGPFE